MGIAGGGHCLLAALDRASSELHALSQLAAAGEIRAIPVCAHGPMALDALDAHGRRSQRQRLPDPHLLAPLVDLPDLHGSQRLEVDALERTEHAFDDHLSVRDDHGPSVDTSPEPYAARPPSTPLA
jgi:hypothetical protein